MTRNEAREYIIKHCNPHRDTGTRWDDAMECAIRALEQPEQRWIPCSERLPEEEEEERHYWVCTDTGYQCQCRWTNDVYGFGASDRWKWKIFDIPQYQKVVAWMPLPKPYKEEE